MFFFAVLPETICMCLAIKLSQKGNYLTRSQRELKPGLGSGVRLYIFPQILQILIINLQMIVLPDVYCIGGFPQRERERVLL